MNFHPQVIFYAVLFAVLGWCALVFFRKSSIAESRRVALQWLKSMDVRVEGERYQGERTTVIREIESVRIGFVGFAITLACHTKSGRPFLIEIRTTFNLVTAWELIALSVDDMVDQLTALEIPVPPILEERKVLEAKRAAAAARSASAHPPSTSSRVPAVEAASDSDFSFDLGEPQ